MKFSREVCLQKRKSIRS